MLSQTIVPWVGWDLEILVLCAFSIGRSCDASCCCQGSMVFGGLSTSDVDRGCVDFLGWCCLPDAP